MKERENNRIIIPSDGIVLLGTVKGLVSDSRLVSRYIDEYRPSAIGLHISPEELKGLKEVMNGRIKETPMSSYEMVYARKLSRFGEVQIPSPALREAYEIARMRKIKIIPLDMDDNEYSDVYTRTIGGLSMIRSSMRLRSINRKRFDQKTVEDFILKWDRSVNGTRHFTKLETIREGYMARKISDESKEHDPILCIVELERIRGIADSIRSASVRNGF